MLRFEWQLLIEQLVHCDASAGQRGLELHPEVARGITNKAPVPRCERSMPVGRGGAVVQNALLTQLACRELARRVST